MTSKTRPARTLTMAPADTYPGTWGPATTEDQRLLREVLLLRQSDVADRSQGSSLAALVALCANRGVEVVFRPQRAKNPPPSPASNRGRGVKRE